MASLSDKRKYVVASAEWGATLSAQITAFEARIKANRERNTELRVEARARKAEEKRMRTTAKRQAKTIQKVCDSFSRCGGHKV